MTKEEEKAIERLKNNKEYILKCGNKKSKHFKAVVTVLNILKKMKIQEENYKNLIVDVSGIAKELGLEEDGTIDEIYAKIKEKEKQINSKNGTINALQCALKERTEERDRKDNIVTKQRKIIDLMANSFAEEGFYSEHCQTLIDNEICPNDCDKCVKQYFERKARDGEN